MGDGYKLIPPITIPTGATDISIGNDGTVSYSKPGATDEHDRRPDSDQPVHQSAGPETAGRQHLHRDRCLRHRRSTASPAKTAPGTLLQGFLEASNVDPVKELVTLIKTQRAFELNSQSIQTADQALQTIGNLRRG